ncbi:putative 2OG-Fe(II) oxygenase [Hyphomonadaceae bacterium BL14]|nr:putative 2OG-Fe(II) oxygenase [Hyphomonadaceae bacterium BL14]
MPESLQALCARADALKAQKRLEEALAVHELAAAAYPDNPVALHNLAASQGDCGRHEASAANARRAIALGLKAGETRVVLARALMQLGALDAAAEAYDAACAINAAMVDAQLERCQLIWMRTGDQAQALDGLERDIAARPGFGPLEYVRARALDYMGDLEGACAQMEALAVREPRQLVLQCAAVYLLTRAGQLDSARARARQALQIAPEGLTALEAWTHVCLATGDGEAAQASAQRLVALAPDNQNAVNLQAMAWRMSGDRRFDGLYDYHALVRPQTIAPPPGWTSQAAYLADLAAELKAAHPYRTHPFGQSVRHGSQRPDILSVQTPAIQAFRQALDPLVDAYIEGLGEGGDPLRRRRAGRWRIHGVWSVWLTPGGFHTDHVHPDGWISSAFYVELPDAVSAGGREGWIRFGEAGIPVTPAQSAQHWVKPEPGMLVLFPSYMWHGTVPFGGEQARLTMAMDIVPA